MLITPVYGQTPATPIPPGSGTTPVPSSAAAAQNQPVGPQAYPGVPGAVDYRTPSYAGYNYFTRNYRAPAVGPINVSNTGRIEQLMRGGKIYLSLQDAIALALENNLDIEMQRYTVPIAESDVLRAEAGGLLRGVPTSISQGASSAANLQTGTGAGTGVAGAGSSSSGSSTQAGGTIITSTGSTVLNYDPVLFLSYNWGHNTSPQANSVTTGIPTLVYDNRQWQSGVQKAWTTGTLLTIGYGSYNQSSNNLFAQVNPVTSGSASIQLQQRILQGFGFAANTRYIRIAKNDMKIADLVFKQQVMQTIASVVNLYTDLVSFNENVKVRRQALALNEKLYNDNRKQVEIGTLAPIEIVRAEAEVAGSQQELVQAETQVLQQETILKNALSRTGVFDPAISEARVIPTDSLSMPAVEHVQPLQDLVEAALRNRPEIAQAEVNITNSKIALAGDKSQLLPSLDLFLNARNNGLAGQPNDLPIPVGSDFTRAPYPGFIGDYGSMLSQIFRRSYPDYSIGFQLSIPLKNRSAQADLIRDELSLRQSQLQQRKQFNQVKVDVQNALIGLQQARAQYQAAQKARTLQEQTLDAEQKKYSLGASTIFFVIQAQRDLSQALYNEVSALSTYNRAKVQMDLATGRILDTFDVSIEEAKKGQVSRPPSTIPAVEPQGH